MSKYVAILHDGKIIVHMPAASGEYYTLCGEDGDDPDASVDSVAVDVPNGARIDCRICKNIWDVCKGFTTKDFNS
jgi:hypothetical protein